MADEAGRKTFKAVRYLKADPGFGRSVCMRQSGSRIELADAVEGGLISNFSRHAHVSR